MRYGVCTGDPAGVATAAKLGFDYVEAGFAKFAEAGEDLAVFRKALAEYQIPCESANCFIPGSLKITGPDADPKALAAYIGKGMYNAAATGLKTVVFGSGGARQIPAGFPYDQAIRQIITFLRDIVEPVAAKYDITVVVEPLCDCNVIRSVREGAAIAAAADAGHVRLLGDLFHMAKMGDTHEDILAVGAMLRHAHIAEPTKRVFPAPGDGFDYKPFLQALEAVGCPRCSVEARTDNFEADASAALKVLKG
ncbi:MAG: sugar phosphate isomerase/epimerase [Clostridia bacterium]|nr:sugar phosphate isomerase/epimerase [Clostridia bacterium]MBR0536555.1 sugar phosphate isomerase/epimerase [Clostridia bacterium]